MAFEYTVRSGQKLLRCGYTTGTCAALSSAGAVRFLLSGREPETLSLLTPKGIRVTVEPYRCEQLSDDSALCSVLKDGGDDIDATHGMELCAEVTLCKEPGIIIEGGKGVGRVTKEGLDQPVGAAAINSVPRKMIAESVHRECESFGYQGGVHVLITIPEGKERAKKTFNPVLGIEGGLSVLGTSGIVEPMSEQALIDTIMVELKQKAAQGYRRLIITPGNYGSDYLAAQRMDQLGIPVVRFSNFVGDTLDILATLPFEEVLMVGHLGKFVKLAGGIMNTHSRYADCRLELLCAHAAMLGAGQEICEELMKASTTDAALDILEEAQLRTQVMESIIKAAQRQVSRRVDGHFKVGVLMFSNKYGLQGMSKEAEELLLSWK